MTEFEVLGPPVSKQRPRRGLPWTQEDRAFLCANYPIHGKQWCMVALNKTEPQIRSQAARLKLRLNHTTEFWREFQERAATTKIGRKRPEQALVMKRLHAEGRLLKTPAQCAAISARVRAWIAENGHPRGALGMKHTPETIAKMSASSKAMWRNMSEEQRDMFSKRASINGALTAQNRATASWKAGWREVGGKRNYYRSRWEANYARYLQWLQDRGEIQSWEHEPETFWFEGIKRGCMSYLPDFRVVEKSGQVEYHEVKGWMDDRSKTKIRRMAKYHPEVSLLVVDAQQYRALERTAAALVDGWES